MTRDHLDRRGLAAAVAAFLMWGLFPLYWQPLSAVPALEVVAHRTVWAFLTVVGWVVGARRWPNIRTVAARPRTLAMLACSATLIAVNWLLYIWAVTHGHVVESSLGYYINPLVNVVLGVAVLRERLGGRQKVAVALAAVAVTVLTLEQGRLPWIALGLAVTFGLYGLARKTVAADAVVGLTVETALLAPLAAGYLLLLARRDAGAFLTAAPQVSLLLLFAGPVTAVPLALFAAGARRLPLSTVGMIQYLSPTCQFLIAVFLFGEPFTGTQLAAFGLIWIALALLTLDLRRRLPPAAEALEPAP